MAAVALLYQYIRMPKPKTKKDFSMPPPPPPLPPLSRHGSETVGESGADDDQAAATAAECDPESVSEIGGRNDDELDRLERAVTRGENHGLSASIE